MNELIEKLGNKAGVYGPIDMYGYYNNEGQVRQFAELIIQEMCQVMKAEGEQFSLDQNFDALKGVGRCMRRVKEHFGVDQ